MRDPHYVVVDGSNLATEGRTTPSLAQLDEAVRAYAEEDPSAQIVVVVDASFEHRIDPSEREQFEQAEQHGEVVSPPAGAIGRGDAFVLRIAERTQAAVLSNDSFQEFHGEHPWLFDEGRLIGGKPVPGVGWIFTPRTPVRGPKSRQATGKSKGHSAGEPLAAPAKAAELAKAARKAAARRAAAASGAPPQVGDVWPGGPTGPAPMTDGTPPTKAAGVTRATKAGPPRSGPEVGATKKSEPAVAAPNKGAKKAAKTTKKAASRPGVLGGLARRAADENLVEAIGVATAEVLTPEADQEVRPKGKVASAKEGAKAKGAEKAKKDDKKEKDKGGEEAAAKRRRRSAPPPAVNEPLPFITFVAAFPVGSEVEGEVASFTSHGAMVEVSTPDGATVFCYIPLTAMGDPAPRKAREVLNRGERRTFRLVSLDPTRRVAELALPELAPAGAAAP